MSKLIRWLLARLHVVGSPPAPSPSQAPGVVDFYVEFEVADEASYQRLDAVTTALATAKRDEDFRDEGYWMAFFDDQAQARFWWPSEAERQERRRRWEAAPVGLRLNDPSFRPPAWLFASMIEMFEIGDYEVLGCRRVSPAIGRLEFEPHGWPYGGTGCMRTLIEAFGHLVTVEPAS